MIIGKRKSGLAVQG